MEYFGLIDVLPTVHPPSKVYAITSKEGSVTVIPSESGA